MYLLDEVWLETYSQHDNGGNWRSAASLIVGDHVSGWRKYTRYTSRSKGFVRAGGWYDQRSERSSGEMSHCSGDVEDIPKVFS
jgi:hypothetical protein